MKGNRHLDQGQRSYPQRGAGMQGFNQTTRLAMDILSDPLFTVVPFALWVGLIAVALSSFLGEEKPGLPFRSARDILEEHLTRQAIGCEEYVDRRKALDYITGMV
jgi:hypothetical protein